MCPCRLHVIDASALLDALDGRRDVVDRIGGEDLHASHLLDIEVLISALRRLVVGGRMSSRRAAMFRRALVQADIRRYPHIPLVEMAWSLRGRVSAYDATYVALSTVLEVPLITTDRKLGPLDGLPCTVEVP